jgi:sugar (pentulose or hexulose) kinase
VNHVTHCIDGVLAQAGSRVEQIAAVGIATLASTFLALDMNRTP